MSDSYTNLLYYIIFSRKDRRPLITPEYEAKLYGWMDDVFPELKHFSWQRSYGAFTVSQSNVEEVRR
jgi:hypothetical protein